MLLQRTLFTGPRAWVNQDLYARNCSGTALRARHHITLDGGGSLSTNTYFGRFPASYWQRWTRVTSVNATGTIAAAFSAAWPKDGPMPGDEVASRGVATGFGDVIEQKYKEVERSVGNVRDVVIVRYSR